MNEPTAEKKIEAATAMIGDLAYTMAGSRYALSSVLRALGTEGNQDGRNLRAAMGEMIHAHKLFAALEIVDNAMSYGKQQEAYAEIVAHQGQIREAILAARGGYSEQVDEQPPRRHNSETRNEMRAACEAARAHLEALRMETPIGKYLTDSQRTVFGDVHKQLINAIRAGRGEA